jgi:hypothetical protein
MMLDPATPAASPFLSFLTAHGVFTANAELSCEPLAGGVSSDMAGG